MFSAHRPTNCWQSMLIWHRKCISQTHCASGDIVSGTFYHLNKLCKSSFIFLKIFFRPAATAGMPPAEPKSAVVSVEGPVMTNVSKSIRYCKKHYLNILQFKWALVLYLAYVWVYFANPWGTRSSRDCLICFLKIGAVLVRLSSTSQCNWN